MFHVIVRWKKNGELSWLCSIGQNAACAFQLPAWNFLLELLGELSLAFVITGWKQLQEK